MKSLGFKFSLLPSAHSSSLTFEDPRKIHILC